MKISAAIITFNEEKNIGRCIDSLNDIADEIVVLDSFSSDRTQEICESKGVIFLQNKFPGHIEQKNLAIDKTKHEFIISLDADEAVSEELKKSILAIKTNGGEQAYSFNRKTYYCGHWVKYCGWYPDVKTRFFKRQSGQWGGTNPHDKFIVKEGLTTKHLSGDLLHYSFYTVQQHKDQAKNFSAIGAQALFNKGKRSSVLHLIFKPFARFVRNYIIKLGFLDGIHGWRICVISAQSNYLKYAKLLALQKGKNLHS
jgi:glycosyltransferase involved in cell wall biosynthesis